MEHRKGASGQLLGPEALVLRVLGLWRQQQGGGNLPGVLIASVTLASIAVVPAGAALRLCADFPEELEELVLCSYMFIICSGSLIKVALLIGEGGTLRDLVRLLSDTRRQYGSGDSSDCIRNRYTRIVDRLHRYFQVMTVPALMCWVASPLLSNGALTAGQQDQRQLPLPLWLPADTHASPTYELLFIIQATCLTITAEATLCLDVFFVRLMMFVAAEIEVLDQSISTMHNFHLKDTAPHDYLYGVRSERSLMATGVCHSTPPVDESSDIASDEMFSKLVKNVLHHQAILRSASLLQTAMNVSTFILLFFNMANLCSIMFVTSGVLGGFLGNGRPFFPECYTEEWYRRRSVRPDTESAFQNNPEAFCSIQLLQRDGNLTKAMKAFLTIPPVLFQTGMYCIFGQITTDQSEKLSHSAFSCGWINCNSHFKRSLLIFMMMVGRPVEITVGKTCQLSKQMLLQVLNGTYVLLNMLFQVRNTE